MSTARLSGRPVLILLDTHRVSLADTEAANDIPPDASRTFSAPKRKQYWAIPLFVLVSWIGIGGAVLAVWP